MSLKTYDDMTAAFPNVVQKGVIGDAPARSDLLPAPYTDFVYGHRPKAVPNDPLFSRAVALVRNPLDQTISHWHYAHVRRSTGITLDEFAPENLVAFKKKFSQIKRLSENFGTPILHYEDLTENPTDTFREAFLHYKLPIDSSAIKLAVDHASIKNARAFEDKHGYMHVSDVRKRRPGSRARFVRDGSIGQWRTHLPDGLKMVEAAGIDPSLFRFEATDQQLLDSR